MSIKNLSMFDPHQLQGVSYIMKNESSFIMWSMGLGKTPTTLTAYNNLLNFGLVKKVLIISHPSIVSTVWQGEAKEWEHLKHLEFNVIEEDTQTSFGIKRYAKNQLKMIKKDEKKQIEKWALAGNDYKLKAIPAKVKERIRKLDNRVSDLKELMRYENAKEFHVISVYNLEWLINSGLLSKYSGLIIDESSLFKAYNSNRFANIKTIIRDGEFKYKTLLSGTPNSNSYQDLWSQLFILDEGDRLGKNITAFRKRYMIQGYQKFIWNMEKDGEEAVKEDIKDICFNSDIVIDTPKARYIPVNIELDTNSKEQIKLFKESGLITGDNKITARIKELYLEYKEFEITDNIDGIWENEEEFNNILNDMDVSENVITIYSRLLTLASGFYYRELGDSGERETVKIHTAKTDKLKELVELHDLERFIIVYNFTEEKKMILDALNPKDTTLYDKKKSANIIETWKRKEIKYLVVHAKSISHGVNGLQVGGHNLIWFSPTSSLETYLQMNKRIERRGQTKNPNIFNFIATGDEKKVYNVLKKKNATQDDLLKAMMQNIIKG